MKRAPLPSPKHARSAGGVVVEFALLLTLMISLFAGIFEIGRTFWYYDALSKATRNAARTMSISPKATIASAAVGAAKTQMALEAASAGVPGFSAGKVTITCLDDSLNDATCTNNVAPGGVRVEVTGYQVQMGAYVPFLLGGSPMYNVTLAPSTTMPYML
jgi:Flp pilus assembly protein TadG